MTKFKALLAALAIGVLATPVAGCALFARTTGQEQVATYDEKALISVELAYSYLLTTLGQANAAGAISPAEAERILPALERTQAAVVRARALYDAGNAVDAALVTQDAVAQVAALVGLLTELGIVRRAA